MTTWTSSSKDAATRQYWPVGLMPSTLQTPYEPQTMPISPQGIESPHLAGMTHYERLDDGKQYAHYRHPMNGHIYERVDLGRVRVIDLDGNESLFDDEGRHLDGPITQGDPHLCKWIGGPTPEGVLDAPLSTPVPPEGMDDPAEMTFQWWFGPPRWQLEDAGRIVLNAAHHQPSAIRGEHHLVCHDVEQKPRFPPCQVPDP